MFHAPLYLVVEGLSFGHLPSGWLSVQWCRVTTVVAGKNIGYGATCELVVQAAVVLLTETERIPGPGGVLTPGFAFADTSLVQRYNRHR